MEQRKFVYLMRGLPSTGKSHTAKRLAGKTGVVCETDEYFYTQVGDDPMQYDYQHDRLEEARRWNFERFQKAVHDGITPIVVDRGNGLTECTQIYARYAVDNGYEVALKEPESEWWQEIRVLLKYKQVNRPILLQWADILARMNRGTHRVPAAVIRRRMKKWKFDLTVADILKYDPHKPKDKTHHESRDKSPLLSTSFEAPHFGIGPPTALMASHSWAKKFLAGFDKGDDDVNANRDVTIDCER